MALSFAAYQAVLKSFNYMPQGDLPRQGNALAGQVGDLWFLLKKVDGASSGDPTLEQALEAISYKIADVISYTVHLASAIGVDVEQAVIAKFNIIAERTGSPLRLGDEVLHDRE